MKLNASLIALPLLLGMTTTAIAGDQDLPEAKQTERGLYLNAGEAHALKEAEGSNIALVDVRTRAEAAFVGMPSNADAMIPFLNINLDQWDDENNFFELSRNEDFLASVELLLARMNLDKDSKVLLICRSGGRSAAAANLLAKAGFSQVYTITDGFEGDKAKAGAAKGTRSVNGWKNSGAPWSSKLDKVKIF